MGDEKYLQWIRGQPCAVCEGIPPSHPHHHTHGATTSFEMLPVETARARGKGQKAHDSWAFPLCWKHHRQFHDASGHFSDWDREKRRQWQTEQVRRYRELHEIAFDPEAF